MEIVIRLLEMWLELGSKVKAERSGNLCIELILEALELEESGEQENIRWKPWGPAT